MTPLHSIPGAIPGAAPAEAQKHAAADKPKVDPKLAKAAEAFEAIFIRQLLKPLENAAKSGASGTMSAGSDVYGSMMVGAVADSASSGGGIGLSHLILEALTRGHEQKTPGSSNR